MGARLKDPVDLLVVEVAINAYTKFGTSPLRLSLKVLART
jgi:hypothetical protein